MKTILLTIGILSLGSLATGKGFPESVTLPALPTAIANSCFECHDSSSAEAEIDLESLESGAVDPFHATRILEEMRLVIEAEEDRKSVV